VKRASSICATPRSNRAMAACTTPWIRPCCARMA
jgi:hypothetical protein